MRSTPLLAVLAFACTPPPDHRDGAGRPLSPGDWKELRSSAAALDLAFSWVEDPLVPGLGPSWQAVGGRGRIYAGERGLTVVSARQARPDWSVGLELTGFGRGTHRRSPGAATVWADGASFEAVHDGVVEFAEHDAEGFEHGFHVLEDPGGTGPLTLELAVSGARPYALDDGAAFVVKGHARVDWRGLAVFDAGRRPLDAHTEVEGRLLRVVIDDAGARYPLLVDPTVTVEEPTTVLAGGPSDSTLGFSIASAGDRVVVGDPSVTPSLDGVAHVVERNVLADAWGAVSAPLRIGNVPHQGFAVAAEGDEVALSSELAGEVHLFRLGAGGEWGVAKEFQNAAAEYGWAIAIQDRVVYISAPGDNERLGTPDSGAVFVHGRENDQTWTFEKVLPGDPGGRFGEALSVSGERFAVGSPAIGQVSVFRHDAAPGRRPPIEVLHLELPGGGFGSSVALDHDVLAVGAPGAGRVLVYERVSSDPVEEWSGPTVVAAPPGAGASFGARLALTSDTLAVTDRPSGGMAKVHTFERRGEGAWGWVESFEAGVADDAALPVTLQPTLLAVGVPAEGTWRVWRRTGTRWASDSDAADPGDALGWAAAVSGDLVVVGAPGSNDGAFAGGKVYTWVRTAPGEWEPRGTRAGTQLGEAYGSSVAVDRDLVAVGASGSSTNATNGGEVEILRFDGDQLDRVWSYASATPYGGLGASVALDQELLAAVEVNAPNDTSQLFRRSLSLADQWLYIGGKAPGQPWDTITAVAVWNGWAFHRGYGANRYSIVVDQPGTYDVLASPAQVLSSPATHDGFGQSMSASGGFLAVGAPGGTGTVVGKVYLYALSGDAVEPWVLTDTLTGTSNSKYGASVSLRGDDLFVGAPGQRLVYHLRRNQGGTDRWGTVETWASPGTATDGFGSAVATDDATVVVGAPGDGGTAYLFELGATLPPAAADDVATLEEDDLLSVAAPGVLFNDHDPDGTPLLLERVVTDVSHGLLQLGADGGFTFVPEADYAGPDSFTYEISDGSGATSQATVSLTVTPIDDVPVGVADGPDSPVLRGTEDTLFLSGAVSVLDNDTDVDSVELYAEVEQAPDRGFLQLRPDGTFDYAPAADDYGVITFTYRVADGPRLDLGRGRSEPVLVTLELAATNDPPEVPDSLGPVTVPEDIGRRLSHELGLLDPETTGIYDPDGSSLVARLRGQAANGSATVAPDGAWAYLPVHDYEGSDAFTFEVSDDGGQSWSPAVVVELEVVGVNDAPVAAADGPFHTREDTVLGIAAVTLLGNDVDVEDGHPEGLALDTTTPPALGQATWDSVAQRVVYTPNPNVSGTDAFAYRAVDAASEVSDVVQVTVVIDPVNDAPIAVDDATEQFTGATSGDVLANDTDPEGLPLTAELQGEPIGGTIALAADGTFTYTADEGFFGVDRFTYLARDAEGAPSGLAAVELYVLPVDGGTDTGTAPCEPVTWFADADGDGFGDREQARNACEAPPRHVADDTDCDDTRAAVFPGADEVVGDEVDQDCSGADLDLRPEGACDTAPGGPWWAGLALVAAAARRRRR